ncbi:Uncharacterized protein DBV15_12567 [Temnothorax longispinosus]|uniref:Uncharacterized protein n=1 Tax=Temnothorax longispinosus TaxID=300112 RepID=A0A4S2KY58_9HYME|nr:Uncharacterized protein DBV15_12567 [Temnothorax longispinosus]
MKNIRPGRAKELLALNKQKLRVAVGLFTSHSALLRAHLFNLGFAKQKECRLCGDEKKDNVHIPVSYTHLDVYKRQPLGRASGSDRNRAHPVLPALHSWARGLRSL